MLKFLADPTPTIPPFQMIDGPLDAGLFIICDHASALIPAEFMDLGLLPGDRFSHVAWDPGAAQVTRHLAHRLNCPALLSGVSRLVIDCNRQPGHPSSIPPLSCHVTVPGNENLTLEQMESRAERWFWPYHHQLGTQIGRMLHHGPVPVVLSIHSFTPCLSGQSPRPWHVGVLWNRDPRLALPLLAALRACPDLVVGDNQPYSGKELNYSLDQHAGAAGLAHVSIELRQDLLTSPEDCQGWGERLATLLSPLLADPGLRRINVY